VSCTSALPNTGDVKDDYAFVDFGWCNPNSWFNREIADVDYATKENVDVYDRTGIEDIEALAVNAMLPVASSLQAKSWRNWTTPRSRRNRTQSKNSATCLPSWTKKKNCSTVCS